MGLFVVTFLQEILGFNLESEMWLKKMKSGCEEHAVIGRSGSFYLRGDFVRLYNGNRNVGGRIGLVFECFKYLFIFKSGLKQMLCSMIKLFIQKLLWFWSDEIPVKRQKLLRISFCGISNKA